jgi:hypothetical protein
VLLIDLTFVYDFVKQVAEIGIKHRERPSVSDIEPFKTYFSDNSILKTEELDELDGKCSRREILARYLLVSVVLDQGPDMLGVRELLKNVTNSLYKRGLRIFHEPIYFFEGLNLVINSILEEHEKVKKKRAQEWARENDSSSSKYNLFFAQSVRGIISIRQVLDYVLHRWGVPLSIPLLLEKNLELHKKKSNEPLVDYLESFPSAEIMAEQIKDNEKYGMGSAIGDKACHLFAKYYVSIFNLVRDDRRDNGWTNVSYEVPFDSNAGRVLFRSGFLLEFGSLDQYEKWKVIQKGKGKGGTNYIRVTNIRGKKTPNIDTGSNLFLEYAEIVKDYLKQGKNPRSVEIQRIPNFVIRKISKEKQYAVSDFDDGLMFIGTRFCFNHDQPKCGECPINHICKGYKSHPELITDYTT